MKIRVFCFALSIAAAGVISAQSSRDGVTPSRKVSVKPGETASAGKPNPQLTPDQVVRIQVDALRKNDSPEKDAGIRIAYAFSSPANRANIGPFERFREIVHNPVYSPMVNHRMNRLDPPEVDGELAVQRVTLWDEDGRRAVYLFTLTRQNDGEYRGCWMTDGVLRVTDEPQALI